MDDIAIKVSGLSKSYPLRNERKGSDGESINEIKALSDVSFEVKKGESVGVIGPNGSGKSTLLKILAGVTKPTSGTVEISGKIASILDVGAGFHPELSGRDNVYLNGQIHGFSKSVIRSKFAEIVEFSGIEKFIDEPVKNYSNGMYLRLAFSIMAHLDFDVYLFDEALSVGDAEFSLKSKKKLEAMKMAGKTSITVSHNINDLTLPETFLMLENGTLMENTSNRTFLTGYLENALTRNGVLVSDRHVAITDFSFHPRCHQLRLTRLELTQDSPGNEFSTDKAFKLEIEYEQLQEDSAIDIVIAIHDSTGGVIAKSSPFVSGNFNHNRSKGKYVVTCTFPPMLFNAQVYRLSLSFFQNLTSVLKQAEIKDRSQIVQSVKDGGFGEICSFDKVIAFKPKLSVGSVDCDPSIIINTQAGFLPSFDWSIESGLNDQK